MRAVDGEPADLYSVEAKTASGGADSQSTAVRGHMLHNFVMG